ncbi:MAG: hypothetical protein AAF568_03905, partial [Pseudomonadota bacterium]
IQGTGSSEEAATIIQTVINELGDPAKLKTLRSLGINTSQPTIDLLQEIVRSAGGDEERLRKVFGGEAMRGIGLLAAQFSETRDFRQTDALRSIRSDGSSLRAESARIAGLTEASFQGVGNTLNDIIEDVMMPGMKRLADALNALSDKGVKFTIEDAAALAGGAALTIGGAKLALGGARLLGSRRAGGATRGAAGALGAAAGITPVYVTNFPGGMGRRMGFDEAAANFDRGRGGAGGPGSGPPAARACQPGAAAPQQLSGGSPVSRSRACHSSPKALERRPASRSMKDGGRGVTVISASVRASTAAPAVAWPT